MISIHELGRWPNCEVTVKIEESEALAQSLDDLVVKMKDVVAMDIRMKSHWDRSFVVSIYHPNNESISAARKERLRLSAISMSSEQSQTATMSDSVWLGIEPYAALYTHGERRDFVFEVANKTTDSCMETFITDVGLAILRNIDTETQSLEKFFSLDAWKGAFPSLRYQHEVQNGDLEQGNEDDLLRQCSVTSITLTMTETELAGNQQVQWIPDSSWTVAIPLQWEFYGSGQRC